VLKWRSCQVSSTVERIVLFYAKTLCTYTCPVPNGFRDRAISLSSSQIVDKKEILRAVSNTGIYCSRWYSLPSVIHFWKFGRQPQCTLQLVWGHGMLLVCTVYSETDLSRKPLGIGHMYISPSWDILYDLTSSHSEWVFLVSLCLWNKCLFVLTERFIVAESFLRKYQLLKSRKEFPATYGALKFSKVFIEARHWWPPWVSWTPVYI
jgi:hypothetical protein